MQNTKVAIPEIEALFSKAEQLRQSGKVEEALKEYTKIVYFAPRHWPAYFHLGVLFGEKGNDLLAVSLLRRSLELKPDNAVIMNHLADYLRKLSRNEEAKEFLETSWSLDPSPKNISALLKIGKIYYEMNRPEEAISYFDQLLTVPDSNNENVDIICVTRWFRSLSRMFLGDYLAAWDDYEVRNDIPGVVLPELTGEKWSGQTLSNKTIFFAYEQRFGDILQFIRFLPRLKDAGAKIIVQVPPELDRQLRYSYPYAELVSTNEPIPDYDYYQFITSVPAMLKLSREDITEDPVHYLDVDDKDKTSLPVRNDTFLKVGFVWAGQPEPDRSIPLAHYIPLLKHRSVSFFSFQLGDRRKHMEQHAVGWLIHDLSPRISDFYDSSVLLKEMDLLITVDTAIAHQAGALGMPVWLMLLFFSDWRWDLNRDDNIWYPSMKLFRQEKQGDWTEPAKRLEIAFEDWVSNSMKDRGAMPEGS